jgi:hypothetical protein
MTDWSQDYLRLSTNASSCSPAAVLTVVPTHPHPPPVPGYYGLSGKEGVPDALRLVYTYRVAEDYGAAFKYTEWYVHCFKFVLCCFVLAFTGST